MTPQPSSASAAPSASPATSADSQLLKAASFPLWGSRLIEASAGTGKTWTIAALYLRLVLGHGAEQGFERALLPADILVMTFTRAATRELSDRIRERLLGAAQCFRGERAVDAGDAFLSNLMADYCAGVERKWAAWRLAMAAESMDDAAVHTIDAWCQRMLREHAFDSGSLFDEELVADEKAMQREAAQDYWRQQCYPLAPEPLAQVLSIWSGVQALIKDMDQLLNQGIAAQAGAGSLAEVLAQEATQRAARISELKVGWAVRAQAMQDWLDRQLPAKEHGWTTLRRADFVRWLGVLADWADSDADESPQQAMGKTAWDRLTPAGLTKVRAIGSLPIDFPSEFFEFSELQAALEKLPEISAAVRLHAAARVAQRLLLLKRQTGSYGFADMLHRLDAALRGDKGARLRQRILAQYPVALIDEFQDTSPLQYQIFDQIYQTQTNGRSSALLLIGDPKQSIYGFRGADIHSYLQARRATHGRHYVLEINFRSTHALVGVVNHWFAQADRQRPEGAFMFRQPEQAGPAENNPLPFVQVQAHGRQQQLVCSSGTVPAMTLVHDLALRNGEDTRRLFAARCAEQIVRWLNDPQAGLVERGAAGEPLQPLKPLRPADIAVLVRTGKEAAAVRRELARRAVASVYLSDRDSVFDSDEAQDLVHWLRAVATPRDVRLVRAGLATRTVGLSMDELGWLASNDEAFDTRVEQLRQLHGVWQAQGVLAMLRQTLHQLELAARWLALPDGERRLTNYLHLAELLQGASSALDGEQALIRWLQVQRADGHAQSDEQIVRLESDADLVKVITIHKSKGLEFPLVCLPFATSFRQTERKGTAFVKLADDDGRRELRLQFSDEELALAERDRLREDLRLLYVALTRSRHALWLGFAALKIGNSDACQSHKSAAGYVIGGTEPIEAADWLVPLQQLAQGQADMVLQAAESVTPCTSLTRALATAQLQVSPPYAAEFERNWTVGSFSRFTSDLGASPAAAALALWASLASTQLSPIQAPRPADDELGGANDVEPVLTLGPPLPGPATWHQFARGASAGNFLHDQLEWLAGECFALADNEPLAARLRRRAERAGRGAHADHLVSWLSEVVQTRLPGPEAALAELEQVLPEMEFWLPAQRMQASEVDALCRQHLLPGVERPALAQRQLHGMLMGFADLVFEHQDRYWVLDYKSNHLGADDAAYDGDTLAAAMAAHRYDVQAAIYLLALHRLLKLRLGKGYQPEQQLGGAVYLFLRGIKGPQNGVCLIPPSVALLDALDAMLGQPALSA